MVDIDIGRRSNEELLAILLGARGNPSVGEAIVRATELSRMHGGLPGLARADAFEMADAAGLRQARVVAAAFELGRRLELAKRPDAPAITCAEEVAAWAAPTLAALTHEELWLLALDGRSRLRAARQVAKGGLHGASVRVADPLRVALRLDATAFVLVHNHPSGDPTPSHEDIVFTRSVAAAAEIVGVPLVDHVVLGARSHASVPWLEPADARLLAPG